MSWTVYILKCADDTLYTGITTNLEARITSHTDGTGAKYTRGRGPFKLLYREPCSDRSTASQREYEIKNLSRREKIALCQRGQTQT